MESYLDVRRGLLLIAALVLPAILAACDGGGPPPPMLLGNDSSYDTAPPPRFTGVDACGHRVQMQMLAHGNFGGGNAGGSGGEGMIVSDNAGKTWGIDGTGALIGPAERVPNSINWTVTPQPGAAPAVGFPCPPPGKPMTPGAPTG